MAFNSSLLLLPVRAAQAAFALIVLGSLAYAAHEINHVPFSSSPSWINFLIFCAVWTLLALAYLLLAPRFLPALAPKLAVLGVDALTMVFWFAGFVAAAAKLDHTDCQSYGPCKATVAGDVFAAFEWVLFAITTALAVLDGRSAFGQGSRKNANDVAI
ncbi:unnamed protein product [Diplocarpon coronariae]|uniref:MARVEL domain-containing protein n=1 Tax=Diplocarpon coronariae TaxID=2795749 RepID=A0A218Z9D0_9HELO|nr:hypothetical protein JHW43_009227 [Diplocarpon mali]OWP04190.1 hypothetical protein B2J93_669 [Marssonina coronariae]